MGRNHPAITTTCTVIATVCTVIATVWALAGTAPRAAPEASAGSAAPPDGLAVHAGANPVSAVPVPWLEERGRFAFIFDREPNALNSGTIPPIAADNPGDAFRWAYANGGIDASTTLVEITVQGRTEAAIVLTDFRVRVIERRDPLPGYLVRVGEAGGGPLLARLIRFDLDESVPRGETRDQRENAQEPRWSFPLQVSSTDPEYIYLVVAAETCDCSWVAEIDYVQQGEPGTSVVDNGGVPFRTSGASAVQASFTTVDGRSFTWCGGPGSTAGC
jgi:hypothetical protein